VKKYLIEFLQFMGVFVVILALALILIHFTGVEI